MTHTSGGSRGPSFLREPIGDRPQPFDSTSGGEDQGAQAPGGDAARPVEAPAETSAETAWPAPDASPKRRGGRRFLRAAGAVIGVYLAVLVLLVAYWCRQPATFDVAAVATAESRAVSGRMVPGAGVVAATIRIGETLLDKPGGFIHNDRLPPGVFLDNCPSWECGVLMALRDAVHSLRNDFSRAQSQSAEHPDLRRADLKLAIDPKSWMLPAAEDEYRQSIEALRRYFAALVSGSDPGTAFYARADNLADYLVVVEKRLGHMGTRLTASVPDPILTQSLVFTSGTAGPESEDAPVRTPADEIDNVFYCARGYSWALLHLIQGIALDFGPTLEAKHAQATLHQVMRDLNAAIKPMKSPIVLNGDGYGFLANHSLVIASAIARANAALIDLRVLLRQG